jgi:hypothetical protein
MELLGPGQRVLLSGAGTGEAEVADAPEAAHRHLLMSVKQLV